MQRPYGGKATAVNPFSRLDTEIAVVGAGVVGCAVALPLVRRGAAVTLLEAELEPGLAASGTNSGILHTGFDSPAGQLETGLILRSARLRDPLLEALRVPVFRCGALLEPRVEGERAAVEALAANASANGVETHLLDDGKLAVPGESVTDPVAFTLSLAAAATRNGAELRTGFPVDAVERSGGTMAVGEPGGDTIKCRVLVNCAGLGAARLARLAGDDSFDVYPRKGEFLVFDAPGGEPLERILLPVPAEGTKGVLVFPTLDGKVIAGPTAIDQEDPDDWSVRPSARDEIVPKAARMLPSLEDAEPIAAYAGLRPAGRGSNYVIGRSAVCPALVNVAAIRSTGLTAAPAIAERVCELVAEAGIQLGPERPLEVGGDLVSSFDGPWWRRSAEYRARTGDR
jgi:glycerol-3-phosphate dehydrogenase